MSVVTDGLVDRLSDKVAETQKKIEMQSAVLKKMQDQVEMITPQGQNANQSVVSTPELRIKPSPEQKNIRLIKK